MGPTDAKLSIMPQRIKDKNKDIGEEEDNQE